MDISMVRCSGREHTFPVSFLYTEYPMGRIMRDSRLYTVGAGTQEIRRMLIGREFNMEILGDSRTVAQ
jgi:alkylation response protein AidB-like acyl-CoA dehydrogenase